MSQTHVELITIGREILDGRIVDTNSVKMAELLKTQGLIVRHAQRVDDDMERIVAAFKLAETRSDVVLVTGGLGPTSDDLTIEAFAQFLETPLRETPESLEVVENFLKRRQRPMTPSQRKQALIPEGTQILNNPNGSAPGIYFNSPPSLGCQAQHWALMPGVPREMIPMLQNEVLKKIPTVADYTSYAWATHFVAEATLQDRLAKIIEKIEAPFELSFRTRFPENHVGLHGVCDTPELSKQFEKLKNEINSLLLPDTFDQGFELKNIEECVLQNARIQNLWISTVESCTGGLIAQKLTSVAGSSENFWGSWVTYHNQAKINLGVPQNIISENGAVSEGVAVAMAQAGLNQMQKVLGQEASSVCVSTTGIAGPTGGSIEKPVGLCYIALAQTNNVPIVERVQAGPSLSRDQYQLYFAHKALALLERTKCL